MDTNEMRIWDDPIDHELYSNILGEDRPVSIYLPTSYYDDGKEYPVLFHLDGDVIQLDEFIDFSHKSNSNIEFPEMIYVSIRNTDRNRDMSPIETSFCENPGADIFLEFLVEELIPFIEGNYRTEQFRILCGQSYSSVFTLYALLENQTHFNGYVTTSLYFPQCKEYFMTKAAKKLVTGNYEGRYLFMSRGELDFDFNKDNQTEIAINELIEIFQENTESGLIWEYKVYESHGHCPEPSHGDGIYWVLRQSAG